MISNVKSAHLRRNLKQNSMKMIHQNRPKEGIFLRKSGAMPPRPSLLYVRDRANGDFSVILDSERCVL